MPTHPSNVGGQPPRQVRERLAFNLGSGTVPSRGLVEAAIAAEGEPSFATAAYAEPRDWGFRGLVAFTLVLILRPQDQIPALTPFHVAEICAILGIAPMLLHRFAHRLPVFRVTPETLGLILFGGVILATAPFSVWPGGVIDLFLNTYLKLVIVFVLMMNTLTTAKRIEQLTWVTLLCVGYIAGRAVFDYARGINLVEHGRLAGSVSGVFGNPNDLALNMVSFMPAAFVFVMGRHFSTSKRLLAGLAAALMLATIVFTKSRGGALGLIVMFAAVVVLSRKVRPGIGAVAVVAVLVAIPFMPSSFWTRMQSIVDDNVDKEQFTGSREARRILLQEGVNAFLEYPITGVGAGQFKNYNPLGRQERWNETHNAVLQVAAETGIFGLAVFLFLIWSGARAAATTRRLLGGRGRKRSREPNPLRLVMSESDRQSLYAHTVVMTAGLIGWFVCAFFASVAYNWTFYYLLALIVAPRELVVHRLAAGRAIEAQMKGVSIPSAMFSRRVARGAA